jgi:hypothetical protein
MELTKDYKILFNVITDTIEELQEERNRLADKCRVIDRRVRILKHAQKEAEEIHISNGEEPED